jgi:hypothetical protein
MRWLAPASLMVTRPRASGTQPAAAAATAMSNPNGSAAEAFTETAVSSVPSASVTAEARALGDDDDLLQLGIIFCFLSMGAMRSACSWCSGAARDMPTVRAAWFRHLVCIV